MMKTILLPLAQLMADLVARAMYAAIDHMWRKTRETYDRMRPPPAPSHDDTATDPYRSPGEPAAVPPEPVDDYLGLVAYGEQVRELRALLDRVDAADIGATGTGKKKVGPPVMPARDDGFDEWFEHASKNDHVDAVPWALEQRDAEGNVILRADIAPPKPVRE